MGSVAKVVTIRSVLAVLAGIVTLTAISFAIEAVVDPLLLRLFPEDFPNLAALGRSVPARALMFSYGALSIAAGGYVTAWLARRAPLRHAAVMGATQTALTLLAMRSMPNHASMATWIVTITSTLPAALLGGWLFVRRLGHRETRFVVKPSEGGYSRTDSR